MSYFFYLARCADNSLYAGYCKNIQAREDKHNTGDGAKYTRSRRPVKIIYFEPFKTRTEAMRREAQIKKWSRTKKENLIKFGTPSGLTIKPLDAAYQELAVSFLIKTMESFGYVVEGHHYDDLKNMEKTYLQEGQMFLAFVDDQIVGTVGLKNLGNDVCEMKRWYVAEDFRGLGIGIALYQAFAEYAVDHGFKLVTLNTDKELEKCNELYLSLGYKIVKTCTERRPGFETLYYEKKL